jgi:hypothetical protein
VPKVDFRAVSVTGSNTSLKRPESRGGYWSVPKKELVFPAVASFQQGKIRIAKGIKDRDALVNELRNYKRTTNIATGNVSFEPGASRTTTTSSSPSAWPCGDGKLGPPAGPRGSSGSSRTLTQSHEDAV